MTTCELIGQTWQVTDGTGGFRAKLERVKIYLDVDTNT